MPLARKSLPVARIASPRYGECINRVVSKIELRAMLHALSELFERSDGKPSLDFIKANHLDPQLRKQGVHHGDDGRSGPGPRNDSNLQQRHR